MAVASSFISSRRPSRARKPQIAPRAIGSVVFMPKQTSCLFDSNGYVDRPINWCLFVTDVGFAVMDA